MLGRGSDCFLWGVSKQGLRRSMHSLSANLHGLTSLQRTHMGWSRSGCLNNHLLRPPVPVCGQAVAISHGARHLLCKVALPFIDSKINPDKLGGWRRLLLWDLLIKCTVPCYHAFSNPHWLAPFRLEKYTSACIPTGFHHTCDLNSSLFLSCVPGPLDFP